MTARYDDVIVALMNDELDRAILLIQTIQQERKTLLSHRLKAEAFELETLEMAFQRTTDFLPFHGWEAS